MANFHSHMKTIARSKGRSAFAKGMYNAAEKGRDERTGLEHDYSRKAGVVASALFFSGHEQQEKLQDFWGRVEQHHRRSDAVVAREIENSLPSELTAEQRTGLAMAFSKDMSERYGVAVQMNIHDPREPDGKNFHVHYLLTACHCDAAGQLGKKAVELDPIHCRRNGLENVAERLRAEWAGRCNEALERAGHETRVDHRSYEARGIDREATVHLGQNAAALERKGIETERGDINREIEARNREREELARAARQPEQEAARDPFAKYQQQQPQREQPQREQSHEMER